MSVRQASFFGGAFLALFLAGPNVAYRVPGYQGFIVSLTVNNIFDNRHQELIGAPQMGRIGLVQVQYEL